MGYVWDSFLEQYEKHLATVSPRELLEDFWRWLNETGQLK